MKSIEIEVLPNELQVTIGNQNRDFPHKIQKLRPMLRTPVEFIKKGDTESIAKLAKDLFDALIDDDLVTLLSEELSSEDEEIIKVVLEFNKDLQDFWNLPWELITSDRLAETTPEFGIANRLSFTRRIRARKTGQITKLKLTEPLRILLIIAEPYELGVISGKRTKACLEELTMDEFVEVKVLEKQDSISVSEGYIKTNIDKFMPHIVHFVGHSHFENDRAKLAITNNVGSPVWLGAEEFAEHFKKKLPTLVILQSCESGLQSSKKPKNNFPAALLNIGIAGVIASQEEVSNLISESFSEKFYKNLFRNSLSVDVTVQNARRDLSLNEDIKKSKEFTLPTFYTSAKIENINVFDREIEIFEPAISKLRELTEDLLKQSEWSEAFKITSMMIDIGHSELFSALNHETAKAYSKWLEEEGKKALQNQALSETRFYFEKALGVREEVGLDTTDIKQSVENLKVRYHASINKEELKNRLVKKFRELRSIFEELIYLIDESTDEEYEEREPTISDYLNGNINVDDMAVKLGIQMESMVSIEQVSRDLVNGSLVVFIGPDFVRFSEPHDFPDLRTLKNDVNISTQDIKEDYVSLAMLSRLYEEKKSRTSLRKSLLTKLLPNSDEVTNDFYSILSGLDSRMLIVMTCYDRHLESNLRREDHDYISIAPDINPPTRRLRVEYFNSGQDPELSEDVIDYERFENVDLTDCPMIIFRMTGHLRDENFYFTNPDNLTLTEKDYIRHGLYHQYVPEQIGDIITNNGAVFLGNSTEDWHNRILIEIFMSHENQDFNHRYVSVEDSFDKSDRKFWSSVRVEQLEMGYPEFIRKLREALENG